MALAAVQSKAVDLLLLIRCLLLPIWSVVFVFDQCFFMQYVRCVLSKPVIILLRKRELAVCLFISCPLGSSSTGSHGLVFSM